MKAKCKSRISYRESSMKVDQQQLNDLVNKYQTQQAGAVTFMRYNILKSVFFNPKSEREVKLKYGFTKSNTIIMQDDESIKLDKKNVKAIIRKKTTVKTFDKYDLEDQDKNQRL